MTAVPPLLVLGVGNPSRGDDALGPLFVTRARHALAEDIRAGRAEFLTGFQLQIENACDLRGREAVVFVDASLRAIAPFECREVRSERDHSFSTHALSAAALLDAYRRAFGEPPAAWLLAIRGRRFHLGDGLSPDAARNLDAAVAFLVAESRSFGRGLSRPPGGGAADRHPD